jgi:hypothetical protein
MKKVLLLLSIIMLITSCQSRSSKKKEFREKMAKTNVVNDAKSSVTDEVFIIKDGVLIIDETFTVKSKYTIGDGDIIYTLYKNDIYVPNVYTFHSTHKNSAQPITDIKKILMEEYKERYPLKVKPFVY